MFYKCELMVSGLLYDITDNIKNWDDIAITFKRNDYDGIIRSFTNKFEFVKEARTVIINEYNNNYLKSSANIVIYTRNNSWAWNERFRCSLNFTTLSDDGFTLSINAIDDSTASIIKAKKSTQYEYNVSELKESQTLFYDGLNIKNKVDFICGGRILEPTTDVSVEYNYFNGGVSIPLYFSDTEYLIKKSITISDMESHVYSGSDSNIPSDSYFVKCENNKTINLKLSFSIYVPSFFMSAGLIVFYLKKRNDKGESVTIIERSANFNYTDNYLGDRLAVDINQDISLLAGDRLYMIIGVSDIQGHIDNADGELIFQNFNCIVTWDDKINPVNLDVVKPDKLLNKLLKSMDDNLSGIIVPSGENRLDNAMILAAESVRKFPNAKIYSSFSKFSEWMSSVFGYVYDISGKIITFRPRKDYFSDNIVKTIKNISECLMTVNSSLVYSQLNVGYEKRDYESVNGKDEFRFTNIYNTGINLTDNKLELISPYRSDSYGIEFLAEKIGEDTTDSSSDTDVFFVCANFDGTNYILDRNTTISGVISPDTMFNAMYSPTSMIEANKSFLGGIIEKLEYASSYGKSSVTINGKPENRDITLSSRIFSASEYEIETSDIDFPEDVTGIIQFEHQGKIINGYYKNVDFHYTKNQSAKITLIEKK